MRGLCLAACAAAISLAASPALADCCWSNPTVIYAEPPVTIVVPPTGYVLDPSDAYRPVYVVNQGPVLAGARIIPVAVPTYSEGGYAYPTDYPYVRSYYGDRWFAAPPARRYGWRHRQWEGRRLLDRPRVVRPGYGYGHVSPPYDAYAYRPAHGARVIHVRQDQPQQ
jgi:hypothetical protein